MFSGMLRVLKLARKATQESVSEICCWFRLSSTRSRALFLILPCWLPAGSGSRVEGLAVWMRDLLGMSDDLERLGQRAWIGRLEAPVGEFGLGLQAPLYDLLG